MWFCRKGTSVYQGPGAGAGKRQDGKKLKEYKFQALSAKRVKVIFSELKPWIIMLSLNPRRRHGRAHVSPHLATSGSKQALYGGDLHPLACGRRGA